MARGRVADELRGLVTNVPEGFVSKSFRVSSLGKQLLGFEE